MRSGSRRIAGVAIGFLALLTGSCSEIARPKVDPFYAVSVPPQKQILRWSNGPMPKSLDPARAAAAPETDIVRALYEGLTELDSRTLGEVPGVAETWRASADHKTWTFMLRKDARWSNGEPVTASDFVRSWKRLAALREKAENRFLFQNIVGMQDSRTAEEPEDFIVPTVQPSPEPSNVNVDANSAGPSKELQQRPAPVAKTFGVEAIDEATLQIRLEMPDKDLPKLLANPIFRPVHASDAALERPRLEPSLITNGAFKISSITKREIVLERSRSYWNNEKVGLEEVIFIAGESPEKTLEAYKNGEIDVVTNASFSPLALKLLAPYEDFRRTAHSALNFYEVNTELPPFSDRRVREALSVAIDRVKISEGDLEGQMQAAAGFYPFGPRSDALAFDAARARSLLDRAGYPNGTAFPAIRLVINRNDTQQRVARAVSRMWKQHLNIDTTITTREPGEIALARSSGDYDLIRRGMVIPTNDSTVALTALFGGIVMASEEPTDKPAAPDPTPTGDQGDPADDSKASTETQATAGFSEEDALYDMRLIPLYYPMSYALVKPYVLGFEMNAFDAPSLQDVNINADWRAGSVQ